MAGKDIIPFVDGSTVTLQNVVANNMPVGTELQTLVPATFTSGTETITYSEVTKYDYVSEFDNAFAFYDAATGEACGEKLPAHVTSLILGVGDKRTANTTTFKNTFRLTGASMYLTNAISMYFSGKNALAEDFSDFYIEVTRTNISGVEYVEKVYPTMTDDEMTDYSGTFRFYFGLYPEQVGDDISAVLYAKDAEGNLVHSAPTAYGAYTYAKKQFSAGDDTLKGLLVSLFNYGDEAQKYRGYKVDTLGSVKAGFTPEIIAQYLPADRTYVKLTDKNYAKIEGAKAEFKTVTLQLNDTIDVFYTIAILDTEVKVEDLKIKFQVLGADDTTVVTEAWYTPADHDFNYIESNGRYQIRLEELIANQMSNRILATVYVGEEAVSNTLSFSVESYIAGKISDASLGGITSSIIKYGDAAKAYAK